jgi:gas vesicle protein
MSRTQATLLVAGTAVAGGMTGWALGTLFAPASGRALRRRLARKSARQWKTFSYSAERFLNDVTERAAAEFDRAKSYSGVNAG